MIWKCIFSIFVSCFLLTKHALWIFLFMVLKFCNARHLNARHLKMFKNIFLVCFLLKWCTNVLGMSRGLFCFVLWKIIGFSVASSLHPIWFFWNFLVCFFTHCLSFMHLAFLKSNSWILDLFDLFFYNDNKLYLLIIS